jgi:TetR/AcrR family transcriptional regulator, ethionamide resistance regulator
MASVGRQTEKRAAIETAVLEATEALLGEGATFAELNIERIATRAGISRTAFYFYFKDKRELLVRLTEGVNEQLMVAAAQWWTGESDIREALAGVAALYAEHGALMRATVEVSTYDEEMAIFWRGLVGRFVDATRQRIESDQATGRALPGPAHATAIALVWMVERSFYQQLVQSEPVRRDDLVDALASIFSRAVYGS